MTKSLALKQGIGNVLFWSVISAAFIGPGTVTTASRAGASFGFSLLWALVFSTIATIVLQEAAARISIASGKNLGAIIAIKYKPSQSYAISRGLFVAVAFGCAAYQAGNMLGAISGLSLITDVSTPVLTLFLALICAGVLWMGDYKRIANMLGVIVAVMGVAFFYGASNTDFSFTEMTKGAFLPSFPENSALLIIGLVGTTIVPYNLFLGSGISKGQDIKEMRTGLTIAVVIGGIISMAILVVGTQVEGAFSFETLADALAKNTGSWAATFFGFGLFAAGMSSSITSPLAAAVTASILLDRDKGAQWGPSSVNFRIVWGSILLVGLLFGLLNVKPIPAIILAQAVNGMLLPLVAVFLLFIVNDASILSSRYVNGHTSNFFMLIVVAITLFLGVNNFLNALSGSIAFFSVEAYNRLALAGGVSIFILLLLCRRLYKNRS